MISRREFLKVGIAGLLALIIAIYCKKNVKAVQQIQFPLSFPLSFPGNEGKFLYFPYLGK